MFRSWPILVAINRETSIHLRDGIEQMKISELHLGGGFEMRILPCLRGEWHFTIVPWVRVSGRFARSFSTGQSMLL
jgi:hypothetical protein